MKVCKLKDSGYVTAFNHSKAYMLSQSSHAASKKMLVPALREVFQTVPFQTVEQYHVSL